MMLLLCYFYTGDKTAESKGIKLMSIRGYGSDVADAINLDEKLKAASKLPPSLAQFEKFFTGKIYN